MIIIATRPTRQFLFELENPVNGCAYIFIRRPNKPMIESTNANLFQMKIPMPGELGGDVMDYRDAIDVCMAMYRYKKIVISCDDSNSVRRGTLRSFLESQYTVKKNYEYKFDKKILSMLRQAWSASITAESYRNGDRRVNRNLVTCVLSDATEMTAVVHEERDKILNEMLNGADLLDLQIGRISIDEFDLVVGKVRVYARAKNLVSHIKSLSKCDQTH